MIFIHPNHAQDPGIQTVCQNPGLAMQTAAAVLKSDDTSRVCLLEIKQKRFVIKQHYHRKGWHALRRAFVPTRAKRSFYWGQRLQRYGFAVCTPVAAIEHKVGKLNLGSFLITEWVEGPSIYEYACSITNAQAQAVQWQRVVSQLIEMLQRFEKIGIRHRDLNLHNFILHQGQPVLIDIDGIRAHHLPFTKNSGFRKEKQRFLSFWQELPHISQNVLDYVEQALRYN